MDNNLCQLLLCGETLAPGHAPIFSSCKTMGTLIAGLVPRLNSPSTTWEREYIIGQTIATGLVAREKTGVAAED